MSTEAVPLRRVRCPNCGQETVYDLANAHRPFCSPRCKGDDFGAWASERYAVPARDEPDEGDPTLP